MTCPICSKASVERYSPFCSQRCAHVDLGKWMTGQYAIPISDDTEEDGQDNDRGEERSPPH